LKKFSTLVGFAQVSLLALFVIAGCGRSEAPAEDQHAAHAHDEHAHHAVDSDALTPPEGERWETDEALRSSMERLRATVEETLPADASASGTLDAATAQTVAQTVEREIAFMIENCKLPPEPDAALHVLIARMMSASNGLKKTPPDADGLSELVQALDDYGTHFEHEGWAPIEQKG